MLRILAAGLVCGYLMSKLRLGARHMIRSEASFRPLGLLERWYVANVTPRRFLFRIQLEGEEITLEKVKFVLKKLESVCCAMRLSLSEAQDRIVMNRVSRVTAEVVEVESADSVRAVSLQILNSRMRIFDPSFRIYLVKASSSPHRAELVFLCNHLFVDGCARTCPP